MAYGTDSGLTNYAAARGITIEGTESVLLTLAHDYIESLDYIGEKTQETQTDQWPRKDAIVDGEEIDKDTVPQDIIDAEFQTAIAIDQGNSPFATITPSIKSETVDTISVEFQDGAGNRSFDPMINLKLRKYLRGGTVGSGNIGVSRA